MVEYLYINYVSCTLCCLRRRELRGFTEEFWLAGLCHLGWFYFKLHLNRVRLIIYCGIYLSRDFRLSNKPRDDFLMATDIMWCIWENKERVNPTLIQHKLLDLLNDHVYQSDRGLLPCLDPWSRRERKTRRWLYTFPLWSLSWDDSAIYNVASHPRCRESRN